MRMRFFFLLALAGYVLAGCSHSLESKEMKDKNRDNTSQMMQKASTGGE